MVRLLQATLDFNLGPNMFINHHRLLNFATVIVLSLAMFGQATAQVKSFSLSSLDGSKLVIEPPNDPDEAQLTVLLFTGTECPLAKLYAPRVAALAQNYSKSVRFFGISSNQQDSADEFKQFIATHKIQVPLRQRL